MQLRLSVLASVALGALCLSAGCSDDETDPGGNGGSSGAAGKTGGGGTGGTSPRGGSAGTDNTTAGSRSDGGATTGGSNTSPGGAGGDPGANLGGDAGAGGSGGDDGSGGAGPVATITMEPVKGTLQGGEGAAKTLYFFGRDLPSGAHGDAVSSCVATCNDMWPVFHEETVVPGDGLSAGDFGELTRPDGKRQTTFQGWPLYTHAPDALPGDRIGDGKLELWHAVEQPFYTLILRQAMIENNLVTYMADGGGRTLYKYPSDTPGDATTDPVSTCTSPMCVRGWPTVAPSRVKPVSSISGAFDIFIRDASLSVQLTYAGYPLYHFVQDVAPGDLKGVGKVGGWTVAVP